MQTRGVEQLHTCRRGFLRLEQRRKIIKAWIRHGRVADLSVLGAGMVGRLAAEPMKNGAFPASGITCDADFHGDSRYPVSRSSSPLTSGGRGKRKLGGAPEPTPNQSSRRRSPKASGNPV